MYAEACNSVSYRQPNIEAIVRQIVVAQAAGQLPPDPTPDIMIDLNQSTSCVNTSLAHPTAPILSRCWPYDVARYTAPVPGQELNAAGVPEPTYMSAKFGPIGCNAYAVSNVAPLPIAAMESADASTAGTGGGDTAAGGPGSGGSSGSSGSNSSSMVGIIVGCVVGGVVAVLAVTGVLSLLAARRRRRSNTSLHRDHHQTDMEKCAELAATADSGGSCGGPCKPPHQKSVTAKCRNSSSSGGSMQCTAAGSPGVTTVCSSSIGSSSLNQSSGGATTAGAAASIVSAKQQQPQGHHQSSAEVMTRGASATATASADMRQQLADADRAASLVPVTPLTPLNAAVPLNVSTADVTSSSGAEAAPGTQQTAAHQQAVSLLLGQVIGRGSFGKVVEGLYGGRRVAVKLIDTGLLLSALVISNSGRAAKAAEEAAAAAGPSREGGDAAGAAVEAAAAVEPVAVTTADAASDDGGEQHDGKLEDIGGRRQQQRPPGRQHQSAAHATAAGVQVQDLISALGQEVEVLARVRHDNIVTLLAANLRPPHVCLVMERMDTSLDRLLYKDPSRRLPVSLALRIALQVARALQYLHPTILHRDLKPANVLISHADDGDESAVVAKLADFGLARLKNTAELVTRNPEVGTDCYSFGVLLWELVALRRPWDGSTMMAVAVRVTIKGERPPLEALREAGAPPKLVRLVSQCFEADPFRRPAAAEIVKALMLVQEELKLRGEGGLGKMGGVEAAIKGQMT
ncbi:hypothetical protein HXX76_003091 [Chlamydomonas incerta]|uniref:Protein kinase domain-containing protein n=1 Tax=Chlamydomonas incerta TaxID=51695 RepID=A0A835TJ89_CHLIN|nr:hypothetical protein HXX76_003091 [Chlamydomonas incerta]|eukprot:KAG2441469.1 hypothetical protein HXX76_003091 [Chlamydomonas incerta]